MSPPSPPRPRPPHPKLGQLCYTPSLESPSPPIFCSTTSSSRSSSSPDENKLPQYSSTESSAAAQKHPSLVLKSQLDPTCPNCCARSKCEAQEKGAIVEIGGGCGTTLGQRPTGNFCKHQFAAWKKIGKGCYGKIYKAIDTRAKGKRVAIKELESCYDLGEEAKWHEYISKAGFTRVAPFYGSFIDAKHFYIVMEYFDGGNLHDYITKHGPLRRDIAASVMYQMSYAANTFHEHGFAHKDLKTLNMMIAKVGKDGKNLLLKIVDFGYATSLNPIVAKGSLPALPKKILDGMDSSGKWVGEEPDPVVHDLYALGKLLYHSLARSDIWGYGQRQLDQLMAEGKRFLELDAQVRLLLRRIWTSSGECRRKGDGALPPRINVKGILDHPFVQSGRELAEEWPFFSSE